MAAAIDSCLTPGIAESGFGQDVNDAGRAVTILGWQGAGDKLKGFHKPRIKRLAKTRDALRDDDAVEAILQAIMVAANMQLAEGILGGAGRLQNDLVQTIGLAAWLCLNVV